MSHEHDKPEALRIKEEAQERERERLDALKGLQKADHGSEKGSELAAHHDETPAEEHRGGPLPNQKR